MRRAWTLWLSLVCGCGALTGCGDSEANEGTGPQGYPYQVTATIGMITDIVRVVAGGHARVEGLIGEGTDHHLYSPTTADVKTLLAAEVIFYNGLMLEGKMGDVLTKMARRGKKVHAVSEVIRGTGDFEIVEEADHYDPHIWMDVSGWSSAVGVVCDALIEFDPDHRNDYLQNANSYLKELRKLDAYAREAIGTIPIGQRVLVTAHDAFGYMSRAYGLEVHGIQGISTEARAGLKDIENLVAFLVAKKIPAVFVESSVPRKSVEALIEGAAAQGHTVRVGGELFSDAMGKAGTYEGTYVGMIDHNVSTIARALGGTVPEGGFQEWVKSR